MEIERLMVQEFVDQQQLLVDEPDVLEVHVDSNIRTSAVSKKNNKNMAKHR